MYNAFSIRLILEYFDLFRFFQLTEKSYYLNFKCIYIMNYRTTNQIIYFLYCPSGKYSDKNLKCYKVVTKTVMAILFYEIICM